MIEVYVHICHSIAGAPPNLRGMHIAGDPDDQPRPVETWSDKEYWALSLHPDDVLIHVYFEGAVFDDQVRTGINQQVMIGVEEFLNQY